MQALCQYLTNYVYDNGMRTGRPSNKPRTPFGRNLHALRERAGLTQTQVAKQLDISARAYAFWEREPVALRPEQMLKLAEILGVTVQELIGPKEVKKRGKWNDIIGIFDIEEIGIDMYSGENLEDTIKDVVGKMMKSKI